MPLAHDLASIFDSISIEFVRNVAPWGSGRERVRRDEGGRKGRGTEDRRWSVSLEEGTGRKWKIMGRERKRKGKEGVEGRMAVQLGRGERALAPLSHATPQEDPSLFPGGRPTSFFFSQGSS